MTKIELMVLLTKHKVPFTVLADGDISISGFSKSGECVISYEEGNLVANTRYGRKDVLESFNDLVQVAFDWWENYREREPFEIPHSNWKDIFIQKGLIEEIQVVTYKYRVL